MTHLSNKFNVIDQSNFRGTKMAFPGTSALNSNTVAPKIGHKSIHDTNNWTALLAEHGDSLTCNKNCKISSECPYEY